jgi:hypothetical protein
MFLGLPNSAIHLSRPLKVFAGQARAIHTFLAARSWPAPGEAEVIAYPFGAEPRFDLRYHQIYANNPDGIVAGSQEWSAWSGDLQRGWLGLRPISDVLVRQDPAQALWTTVELLRQGLVSGPSPSAGQIGGESLGRSIEAVLVPFGIVRSDWHGNAELIATALRSADRAGPGSGVGSGGSAAAPAAGPTAGPTMSSFQRGQSPLDALLSLHSILPAAATTPLRPCSCGVGHPNGSSAPTRSPVPVPVTNPWHPPSCWAACRCWGGCNAA